MPNLMPSELLELLAAIEFNAADIYVRAYNDDMKPATMALADLPAKVALRFALEHLRAGEMPRMIVRDPKGGS